MSTPADTVGIICGILIVCVVIFTVGVHFGKSEGENRVIKEAVKVGSAIWIADESGKPVIKWVVPNK